MDEITSEIKNISNAQAMFNAQMKNARDYITIVFKINIWKISVV